MKLLSFLDRWEYSLFKKQNENHIPFSWQMSKVVFGVAFIISALTVVTTAFKWSGSVLYTIYYLLFGSVLIYVCYNLFLRTKKILGAIPRIMYVAYMFVLFVVVFYLSFIIGVTLSSFLLILLGILLLLWIIGAALGGSGGDRRKGKKQLNVRWNDGKEEQMQEDGRGICGETYYKGKDTGRTYVD